MPTDESGAPLDSAQSASRRLPLFGPLDAWDEMMTRLVFALAGPVFRQDPWVLSAVLLGFEVQGDNASEEFKDFMECVDETGNTCEQLVAAYLANLRAMQYETRRAAARPPRAPGNEASAEALAKVANAARHLLHTAAEARAVVKPTRARGKKFRVVPAWEEGSPNGCDSVSSQNAFSLDGDCPVCDEDEDDGSSIYDGSISSCDSCDPDDRADPRASRASADISSSSSRNSSRAEPAEHAITSETHLPASTAHKEQLELLFALQGSQAAMRTLQFTECMPAYGGKGFAGGPHIKDGTQHHAKDKQRPTMRSDGHSGTSAHSTDSTPPAGPLSHQQLRLQRQPAPPAGTGLRPRGLPMREALGQRQPTPPAPAAAAAMSPALPPWQPVKARRRQKQPTARRFAAGAAAGQRGQAAAPAWAGMARGLAVEGAAAGEALVPLLPDGTGPHEHGMMFYGGRQQPAMAVGVPGGASQLAAGPTMRQARPSSLIPALGAPGQHAASMQLLAADSLAAAAAGRCAPASFFAGAVLPGPGMPSISAAAQAARGPLAGAHGVPVLPASIQQQSLLQHHHQQELQALCMLGGGWQLQQQQLAFEGAHHVQGDVAGLLLLDALQAGVLAAL